MNSFDRVMHTIQGKKVDRIAVAPVLGAYGAKLIKTGLKNLYCDAGVYLQAQIEVQNRFDIDMVLAPFDYSAIAEAFGSRIVFYDNQPPNMKKPAASSAEEFLRIPFPDISSSGRLPEIIRAVGLLAASFKSDKPVFAAIPGPASLPSLVAGIDNWMDILLFQPVQAKKILDYCGKFFIAWGNALLAAGATALIVTEGMAAAEILTPELFASKILPFLKEVFPEIRGAILFHHTGGRINPVLPLLKNIPEILGFALSARDDLIEARNTVGPSTLLLGNIDNISFPVAGSEEYMGQSRNHCGNERAGPFIMASSERTFRLKLR
jgi:uroporphyrinogen decarboxylase